MGKLSPVSGASAVCNAADSINPASAGMVSPSSMRMMSPGTTCEAGSHHRVQQHNGKDGDGFIRQVRVALEEPERGGDPGRDEEQNNEYILKLRQEPPPGRDRLVRGQLVRSVLGEPGARFLVAQPLSLSGPERGDQFARVQPVRNTRLWRYARDGRHVVSLERRHATRGDVSEG